MTNRDDNTRPDGLHEAKYCECAADFHAQLKSAYLAGFKASGEGWNGEYPFAQKGRDPEADPDWIGTRDEAIAEFLAKPTAPAVPADAGLDALVEELQAGIRPCGMHEDNDTELFHVEDASDTMAEAAAAITALRARQTPAPALAVWYGKMPESNGKTNWTAVLHRQDGDAHLDGFCFARSEYPDRVRYEADRMRWIIGMLTDKPNILEYDADLHSGYSAPTPAPQVPPEDVGAERAGWNAAIAWLEKHLDAYVAECGIYDPETGVTEFPDGGEWESSVQDIIDGMRLAMPAARAAVQPYVEGV